MVSATLAVFWCDCAWTSTFRHECLPSVSGRECGLAPVSGSRQHMPDTALWGPAFIPSCFHSPTFGRCTKKKKKKKKKCFLKSLHSSSKKRKKKKGACIYFFARTWTAASYLTRFNTLLINDAACCVRCKPQVLAFGSRRKQNSVHPRPRWRCWK